VNTVVRRLAPRRRRPGRLASTGLAALVVAAALARPATSPLELRTGEPGHQSGSHAAHRH
jgi:hypothetical protein